MLTTCRGRGTCTGSSRGCVKLPINNIDLQLISAIDRQSKVEEDGPDLVGKQRYDTCYHSSFLTSY